jgi:phospholipid transport system transporter-binding protein
MSQPDLEKINGQHYALSGELTMKNVPKVALKTASVIGAMNGEVSVDLSGITRADSAGLALLIDWLRIARRAKVSLRFEKLPEQLTQIAEVCDLHSILPIEH